MNWRYATSMLILAGVVFYIVWDIIVFIKHGPDATESETVGRWMDRSLWVCLAIGLLIGHLIGSGPDKSNWIQAGIILIGMAIGYFCTVR